MTNFKINPSRNLDGDISGGGLIDLNEIFNQETATTSSLVVDPIEVKSNPPDPDLEIELDDNKEDGANPPDLVIPAVPTPSKDVDIVIEPVKPESNSYRTVLDQMVKAGTWEPISEIEDGEGNVVSLDEVEITEEMFESLIAHQEQVKKEKLLSNKIDVEGISDFTKHIIEIEKNGGDVKQALQTYEAVKEPLMSLDLEKVEDKKRVIAMRMRLSGQEDISYIQAAITGFEAQGILDEKAEESFAVLNKAYEDNLIALSNNAKIEKENRIKAVGEYKKNIKESLKTKFDLNEAGLKKLVEIAAKEDANNRFEIDSLYTARRKNPEEAAELVFFLADKEGYLEKKLKEKLEGESLKTFSRFKFIKNDKSNLNLDRTAPRKDKNEVDLETI